MVKQTIYLCMLIIKTKYSALQCLIKNKDFNEQKKNKIVIVKMLGNSRPIYESRQVIKSQTTSFGCICCKNKAS